MEATKKRRGRPRKIILNRGNNSPARKQSNIHVADCKWTAVGSPYSLKIVLKKIDIRNSALVCHQNEVSPTSNKNLKFLSPQLTLPRIDSITKQVEENISFLTIGKREDGQSLQQVYAAYSESVIRSPNMRPVFTRSIYSSMNAVVEDDMCVRRRSRRILKDVKNTSSNQKIRKNASIQPNLDGQENIPVAPSYDTSVALPQVCVRLPQLNDQSFHQHDLVEEYIESSSMVNSS